MSQAPPGLLVRGGRVYDDRRDVHDPPVTDILIEGAVIKAVGPDLGVAGSPGAPPAAYDSSAPLEVIDASGKLVIPGFVNAHYHSHDVLAKGLFEELPLEQWSLYASPIGTNRSIEEVYVRTLLGAVECIRNGITTVQDMNILSPLADAYVDAVLAAYRDAGVRVIYSIAIRDLSNLDSMPFLREMLPADLHATLGDRADGASEQMAFVEAQLRRTAGAYPRLHWALSPSAPQRCTPALLQAVADLAERHDLPVYTHVYETRAQALHARLGYAAHGGSLVDYLGQVGLLGPRLTIAHGVWPRPAEIARLAETDTGVVVNMLSNLKLKSGVAPIPALREAGVRLALGCDNLSCSDVQSMFQAMKLLCLMGAVSHPEAGNLTAAEAIRIATQGGARTAGLEARLGAIRPGMRADLVILDLDDPAYLPLNSAARQLVFSETGRGVETVIVDGQPVMVNGRVRTVDEAELRRRVSEVMQGVRRDFERVAGQAARLLPHMREFHRRVWQHDLGLNRFIGEW